MRTPLIWKTIPGFENYEASSMGQIRVSLTTIGRRGFRPGKVAPQRLAKGDTEGRRRRGPPRLCVSIIRGGGSARECGHGGVFVHKLVALAFLGPRPAGMEIDHVDGDHLNNRSHNLEYVSQKINEERAVALGKKPVGSKNGRSRLVEPEVIEIKRLLKAGLTLEAIASKFDVGIMTICNIRVGRTWRHVGGSCEHSL
jgi:hypothetical protein